MIIKKNSVLLKSNESITFNNGYGLIVVSSSGLGYTGLFIKDPSEVIIVKESGQTANVVFTNNNEYSFTLTNRASINATFKIIHIGYL